MDFDQLLKGCESEIEERLLHALYPTLGPHSQGDLRAQYKIDYYQDLPVTLPDFAFPDARIAIYCDGYEYHSDLGSFQKDRQQSRELQLKGWTVLRFGGAEILNDTESVVSTIQQAIKRKAVETGRETMLAGAKKRWTSGTGKVGSEVWEIIAFASIAATMVIILLEFFFFSILRG